MANPSSSSSLSPVTATTSFALTSLLDSLHTHLQKQTQLLPSLHAQLGLPLTAIEDEFKSLQQQLVEGIENQIDIRRKEVNDWIEKCELVENECIRYSKALGSSTKITGVSVNEVRKEIALPRRYGMATALQEKSRQLYHTKLEQLGTLTNRVNALVRTLGSDYFMKDILEPTVANGEAQGDPKANRDVTPERFLKLEKELVRGKAEVAKRLGHLCSIFIQIDWLYAELAIEPPDQDELLSPALSSPVASTSCTLSLSTLHDPFRELTPTPVSCSSSSTPLLGQEQPSEPHYQGIFRAFVAQLEGVDDEAIYELQQQALNPQPEQRQSHGQSTQGFTPPIGLEGVEPTPGLIAWAETLKTSLEETKKRREAHIQAMYDQLEGLWRRLGVSDEDMDAFVEAHRGSTEETVHQYEEELERMLELKRGRMGAFVASAREEIVKLWDELMVGEEERGCFAPFIDDEHTEELLTIHEDEIRQLKEERRIKAPLLASIRKYFDICEEEKELATAASDQSRLLGRGSRDPGRLLREEKMRKRVSKEKPRLEQDLLSSIPAWEQETGRRFLVHNESILQIITARVSAQDQENINRRRPVTRAGSVPPRAITPVESGVGRGYTSRVKTGVVTPAVRPATSMGSQSVPNKRQRIGDSHSSGHVGAGVGPSQRVPLGTYRGGNTAGTGMGRSTSPTKIPTKASRPVIVPIAMLMPKPGTHHHVLGHGRLPASAVAAYPSRNIASYGSGRNVAAGGRRKSLRATLESFRPRPSIDKLTSSGRWASGYRSTTSVKEEFESED